MYYILQKTVLFEHKRNNIFIPMEMNFYFNQEATDLYSDSEIVQGGLLSMN
jgi:hypothetical protein